MSDAIHLTISGKPYELTPPFTNRELHQIKLISGLRASELANLEVFDNDLLVALAHIALRRANISRPNLDQLWDMPAGEITMTLPDEHDEAAAADVPPTSAPDGAPEKPAGSPETIPA